MCIDMCIDMCIYMCIDMCIDICIAMCINMCIDFCIDIVGQYFRWVRCHSAPLCFVGPFGAKVFARLLFSRHLCFYFGRYFCRHRRTRRCYTSRTPVRSARLPSSCRAAPRPSAKQKKQKCLRSVLGPMWQGPSHSLVGMCVDTCLSVCDARTRAHADSCVRACVRCGCVCGGRDSRWGMDGLCVWTCI